MLIIYFSLSIDESDLGKSVFVTDVRSQTLTTVFLLLVKERRLRVVEGWCVGRCVLLIRTQIISNPRHSVNRGSTVTQNVYLCLSD